jgi:hypothetical protein
MFTRTLLLSQTVAMIYPADSAVLNFFFIGDVTSYHSIACYMDMGLK